MTFRPYERCFACSGIAQPGTKNLMGGLLQKFTWSESLGIYVCRTVAGQTILSNHACGKAADPSVPTNADGSARTELGHQMVRLLADNAWELGITEIIYNRVRYSAAHPRGAYYGGIHPHRDHVHTSQILAVARSLTYAQVAELFGLEVLMSFLPVRYGHGYSSPPADSGLAGDQRAKTEDVRTVQALLVRIGYAISRDGVYGPNSITAARDALVTRAGRAEADGKAIGGIYYDDLVALAHGGGGGGDLVTKTDLANHARARSSSTVHPHGHDEGETGPPS